MGNAAGQNVGNTDNTDDGNIDFRAAASPDSELAISGPPLSTAVLLEYTNWDPSKPWALSQTLGNDRASFPTRRPSRQRDAIAGERR